MEVWIEPARTRTLPFSAQEFSTETLNNLGLAKWKKISSHQISEVLRLFCAHTRRSFRTACCHPLFVCPTGVRLMISEVRSKWWYDGRIWNEIGNQKKLNFSFDQFQLSTPPESPSHRRCRTSRLLKLPIPTLFYLTHSFHWFSLLHAASHLCTLFWCSNIGFFYHIYIHNIVHTHFNIYDFLYHRVFDPTTRSARQKVPLDASHSIIVPSEVFASCLSFFWAFLLKHSIMIYVTYIAAFLASPYIAHSADLLLEIICSKFAYIALALRTPAGPAYQCAGIERYC